MVSRTILPYMALLASAKARDVPSGVKSLYDAVVSQGQCNNILQDGFLSADDGDYSR